MKLRMSKEDANILSSVDGIIVKKSTHDLNNIFRGNYDVNAYTKDSRWFLTEFLEEYKKSVDVVG